MVVGGKQSVKRRGGGLKVKTQSKGEETEGVETEQKGKKEGERERGLGRGQMHADINVSET